MAISGSETQTPLPKSLNPPQPEVELVKCDSCGFTEECTPAYITRIREKYTGRWICGLCGEAVKDEILRSERLISNEEALNRHISFCKSFRSSSPVSCNSEHPIFAIGRILRRNLDKSRAPKSTPSSPIRGIRHQSLVRSESCFSSLSR